MKILQVFIVVIITILSFFQCEANFKVLDPKKFPGTPRFSAGQEREGKKMELNSLCECEWGKGKDGSICANNGIVYRNECQFNCSKKTNPRLKIVQKGKTCAGLNRNSFWGAATAKH